MSDFVVKDSGARQSFASGMVRDTSEGKIEYDRIFDGPMADRWAAHLTKGATKYPDVEPGVPNWTLANGREELVRFRKSAIRHFRQWLRGDVDEDHAAGVYFNIDGYEMVKARLNGGMTSTEPQTVVDLNYPELRVVYEEDVECEWEEDVDGYRYYREGVSCCNDEYNGGYLCTLPADHTGKHCATDIDLNDPMREWD